MSENLSPWALNEARTLLSGQLHALNQDTIIRRLAEAHPNLGGIRAAEVYIAERSFIEAAIAKGLDDAWNHLDDRAILLLAATDEHVNEPEPEAIATLLEEMEGEDDGGDSVHSPRHRAGKKAKTTD